MKINQTIRFYYYSATKYIPNMPLSDEHTGVMNRLGHSSLEHKSLKAAFEKVLHSEGQHVIKLVLAFIQKPIPVHPAKKGLTFKDPPGILLIKGEKVPSIVSDATQSILHPPKLPLAPEPILSNKLELRIQSLLLIRPARLLKCLTIYNKIGHK